MGASRILVVDDDADVCDVVETILARHGYTVQCARDGLAMQDMLACHSFDIALVDAGVAGRSGLARDGLPIQAGMKAILMSGLPRESVDLHGAPFIAKPFRPAELLRVIELVLHD